MTDDFRADMERINAAIRRLEARLTRQDTRDSPQSDDLPPGAVDGGRIPGIAAPRTYRGAPGPGTPRTRHDTRPRSDEQATDVRPDRPTSPEPSDRHTRACLDAITTARQVAGRDAGTVWALTAIAHALLAQGQETP